MTMSELKPSVLTPAEYELRGGITPHSAPIEDIGRIVRLLREQGEVRVAYRASLPTMGAEVYTIEDVNSRLNGDLSELMRRVAGYKFPVVGRIMSEPSTAGSFDVHLYLYDPRVVIECSRQDLEIDPNEKVVEAVRYARCTLEKQNIITLIFRLSWVEQGKGTLDASDELMWFETAVLKSALDQTPGRPDVRSAIRAWEAVYDRHGDTTTVSETFIVDFMRAA